jgi:RNA polymerase sigma-70 factor (ECF subfamily)
MEFPTLVAGRIPKGAPTRPPAAASMDFDASDLARLRKGDAGALEACYRAFGARVRRLCRHLLGRSHDADDATQEVFLKVFERAGQFSGEARFSTWIYRLTVNHCLHLLERERLRRAEPLPDEAHPVWAAADRSSAVDDRELAERLLASLGGEQRAVLLLREVEGLDYREIAGALDLPLGTVMSRLHRARRRLLELAAARSTSPPPARRRSAP